LLAVNLEIDVWILVQPMYCSIGHFLCRSICIWCALRDKEYSGHLPYVG